MQMVFGEPWCWLESLFYANSFLYVIVFVFFPNFIFLFFSNFFDFIFFFFVYFHMTQILAIIRVCDKRHGSEVLLRYEFLIKYLLLTNAVKMLALQAPLARCINFFGCEESGFRNVKSADTHTLTHKQKSMDFVFGKIDCLAGRLHWLGHEQTFRWNRQRRQGHNMGPLHCTAVIQCYVSMSPGLWLKWAMDNEIIKPNGRIKSNFEQKNLVFWKCIWPGSSRWCRFEWNIIWCSLSGFKAAAHRS